MATLRRSAPLWRRRFGTAAVPLTNIGYLRLAFNGGNLALRARVFDTATGRAFMESCPHTLDTLQSQGDDAIHGSLRMALPALNSQHSVPPGGLVYSPQRQHLCICFGQMLAFPGDYFAQIEVGYEYLCGSHWKNMTVTKEDPLAMESY